MFIYAPNARNGAQGNRIAPEHERAPNRKVYEVWRQQPSVSIVDRNYDVNAFRVVSDQAIYMFGGVGFFMLK